MTRFALPIAALAILLIPGVALAADASTGATTVSFAPLLGALANGAVALLGVLGSAVLLTIQRIAKTKAGVDLDIAQGSILRSTMDNAVHFAAGQIQSFVAKPGVATVDVHSAFVAQAAQYVEQHIPEVLTYFGKTPEDVKSMALSTLARLYPDLAAAMKADAAISGAIQAGAQQPAPAAPAAS